jgi:hypothetical protein
MTAGLLTRISFFPPTLLADDAQQMGRGPRLRDVVLEPGQDGLRRIGRSGGRPERGVADEARRLPVGSKRTRRIGVAVPLRLGDVVSRTSGAGA